MREKDLFSFVTNLSSFDDTNSEVYPFEMSNTPISKPMDRSSTKNMYFLKVKLIIWVGHKKVYMIMHEVSMK